MKCKIDFQKEISGTSVRGRVIFLHPNEIRVMILQPCESVSAGRHNFFHDGDNAPFESSGVLTERGRAVAEDLLVYLYTMCEFFKENRQILMAEYGPVRTRLHNLYDEFRETVPGSGSRNDESFRRHQEVLQKILWLNHEFYKKLSSRYDSLKNMGMDTFAELVKKFLE